MKNPTVRMALQIIRNERKPTSFTKKQAISLLESLDKLPVKCYDDGDETFDRYTVVYTSENIRGVYACVAMSSNPLVPNGFCQHSECLLGKHLGKRILFADLPPDCQTAVRRDLEA